MSDPRLAAGDPIFWLHHCNIDRLWEQWLSKGQDRSNPIDNSVWMNQKFVFFDENGQKQEMSGKDILDTVNQLNYVYDDQPKTPPVAERELLLSTPQPSGSPQFLGGTPSGEVIKLVKNTAEVSISPVETRGLIAEQPQKNKRILLIFEGIEYNNPPGVNYEVYLNLPNSPSVPKEEYYVGTIGLFAMEAHGHSHTGDHSQPAEQMAMEGHDHSHTGTEHASDNNHQDHPKPTVVLEATQVVEKLQQKGEWTGEFQISLRTTYEDEPLSEVRFKQISVYTF
jgi:tyrosinase